MGIAIRIAACIIVGLLTIWLGAVFFWLLSLLQPMGVSPDGTPTITAIVTASDGGELWAVDGGFAPSGPVEVQFPPRAHAGFIALVAVPFVIVAGSALVGAWCLPGRLSRR